MSFQRSKVRFQFIVLLISPKVLNQIEHLRWYFVFIELSLLVLCRLIFASALANNNEVVNEVYFVEQKRHSVFGLFLISLSINNQNR